MNHRKMLSFNVLTLPLPVAVFLLSCAQPAGSVTVRPVESGGVMADPGIGFTTFYSYKGDSIKIIHRKWSSSRQSRVGAATAATA